MELSFKLEQFEGPLDLLLTLISKNKVSITDIPIALICDQYMEYISDVKNNIFPIVLSGFTDASAKKVLNFSTESYFLIV